jgi:glyoxylase-like metal-dependent hydrolase (beta-lactamase superfamily II)
MGTRKPYAIVPGVYALGSPWVNWYAIQDEGSLTVVDAGMPGYGSSLEADLLALGFALSDVRALLLTHSDFDHTGMAPRLQAAGAEVWIGAKDEETLSRPRLKNGDAMLGLRVASRLWRPRTVAFVAYSAYRGGIRPAAVKGASTCEDGDILDVPGRPRVVATPGHTAGHSAFHFSGHGALFVGDAMCTWNPLTGRRGPQVMPTALNLSTEECLHSLLAIEAVDAQVVLPGHGAPFREGAAVAAARARDAGRS